FMGAKEDFTQAPTHAHINLVGGVWMFLAGLFYNAHPQLSRRAVMIHYGLTVIGLLAFIPGIAGAQVHAPWYAATVGVGGLLTAISLLYFAVMVFIGTGKAKSAA
ncbi:MAG: hypothetical protein ACXU8U_09385, partial [Asticcacaulis sp.]